MQELKRLPFIRLILPLITGIIFGLYFEINTDKYYILMLVGIFVLIFSIIFIKKYRKQYLSGIFIFISIFYFGTLSVEKHTTNSFRFTEKTITGIALINEPPQEKQKSVKTFLKFISLKNDSTFTDNNQKILSYFEKDSNSLSLKYGDIIYFSGKIQKLKNPGNPHEFDFKTYLERKGISGQIYLSSEKYKITDRNKGNFIFKFAYQLRKKLVKIYEENNISGQELAVLSALTLGDKSELDPETKQAYSSSGAMHILAVSGLHVGIIFMILKILLSFLDKFKIKKKESGKIIKALIIISFLWFFALISGLSPSVRRAALMFSLFMIGDITGRRVNIYNSIAASAFILLIYNPFLIVDVGFQLSYSAVIAIIYFQPKIYKLYISQNKIIDKTWALITVSIAAQIGTLPITFFYFHQFPSWFILTNIIVIPLASLIVYSAAILLPVSYIPIIGSFTGYLLNKIVFVLNWSVMFIESLPYSAVKNITFGYKEMIIIYALLISLSLYFIYRKIRALHFSLLLIIFLLLSNLFLNFEKFNDKKIFIYNSGNTSAYNFINGNQNIVVGDTTLISDNRKLEFAASSNWLNLDNEIFTFFDMPDTIFIKDKNFIKRGNYISYGKKNIILITDNKQVNYNSINKKLNTDYLIISKNVYLSMKEITDLYNPELIIFDSSNRKHRIQKWISECKELNINYFSVPDNGAFSVSF